MEPVKEAAGLTLWVWDDRFNRGGSRCLTRGFASGLFLEISETSGAGLRLTFVPRPELT